MHIASMLKTFSFYVLVSFIFFVGLTTVKINQVIATDNTSNTNACLLPELNSSNIVEKWRWAPENGEYTDVMSTPAIADLDPTDDNNTPQVIVNAFDYQSSCTWQCGGRVRVLDGVDGKEVSFFNKYDISDARLQTFGRSQMAVGNIDADQELEVVVGGSNYCATSDGSIPTQICGGSAPTCATGTQCVNGGVFALNHDGSVLWWAPYQSGINEVLSIFDFDQDGRPEVKSGSVILDGATGEKIGNIPTGYSVYPTVVDIDNDEKNELIAGSVVYEVNERDAASFFTEKYRVSGWENSNVGVADFNGDQNPDLLLVRNSTTEIGVFELKSGAPQQLWSKTYDIGICVDKNNSSNVKSDSICDTDSDCSAYGNFKCDAQYNGKPGAPVIADFDGDGGPDIGVKGKNAYVTINGENGDLLWDYRRDRDDSEYTDISASSSSAFDFNNDGAYEITQRNTSNFYIFDGKGKDGKGVVLFKDNNRSNTLYELAPIVDVDNDGHADIVVPTNYNGSGTYQNTGIVVFESSTDSWPATRTIWNQDNYFIDNICDGTEGIGGCKYGDIPSVALKPWERTNSLRSNVVKSAASIANLIKISIIIPIEEGDTSISGTVILPTSDHFMETLITIYQNGVLLGTTTTTTTNWTLNVAPDVLKNGDVITATATMDTNYNNTIDECDVANEMSAEVNIFIISPLTIQGTIKAGDITISGVGTPDDYVYVFVNNIAVPSSTTPSGWVDAIVDANGNWTLTFEEDEFQTGETIFVETKTDVNRNGNYIDDPVHEISPVVTIQDGNALTMPFIIDPILERTTSITGTTATTGIHFPNVLITVYKNGTVLGSTTTTTTNWNLSIARTDVIAGDSLTATATMDTNNDNVVDASDITSEMSDDIIVEVNNTPTTSSGTLVIQTPVRAGDTQISGIGNPDTFVFLFVENTEIAGATAIAGADGTWNITINENELQAGERVIVQSVIDVNEDGNYINDEINDTTTEVVVGNAEALASPVIISPIKEEDTSISGTIILPSAGHFEEVLIIIYQNSVVLGTITTTTNAWTLSIASGTLKNGDTITTTATMDTNNDNVVDVSDVASTPSSNVIVGGETPPTPTSTDSAKGRNHIFPTNMQIVLNDKATCTASREVTLNISAQNASEIVISENQNFVGTNWENFVNTLTKTWTLSEGDGTKTLYAQLRSLTGDISSMLTANILLDEAGKCGEKNSSEEVIEETGSTTNTNASIPILGEEIEVLGETIEVPESEEKMCSMECTEMNYILYIINPDGSQRLMSTEYTRTETMPDGRKRIKFEDSGFIDQDFNDLWILVDDKNCENLTFTLEQVSARWTHRVGVYILQNNAKKMDVQLWGDSHREETTIKQINAKESKELCVALSGGNPLAVPFVTLYDNTDYNGRFASFNADVENLRISAPFLNDKTKSIKLSSGAKVLLYQNSAYQNTSETLEKSVPNLDLTNIKNNTLSSLKILPTN